MIMVTLPNAPSWLESIRKANQTEDAERGGWSARRSTSVGNPGGEVCLLSYILRSGSCPQLWATRPRAPAEGRLLLWVFQPIGGAVGLWEVPLRRQVDGGSHVGQPQLSPVKKTPPPQTNKKGHRAASKNGPWKQELTPAPGRVKSVITHPQHGAPCSH